LRRKIRKKMSPSKFNLARREKPFYTTPDFLHNPQIIDNGAD
jgi:hypothetical protein